MSNNNATSKVPIHVAYQVKNREGQKAIWTKAGMDARRPDDWQSAFVSRQKLVANLVTFW